MISFRNLHKRSTGTICGLTFLFIGYIEIFKMSLIDDSLLVITQIWAATVHTFIPENMSHHVVLGTYCWVIGLVTLIAVLQNRFIWPRFHFLIVISHLAYWCMMFSSAILAQMIDGSIICDLVIGISIVFILLCVFEIINMQTIFKCKK